AGSGGSLLRDIVRTWQGCLNKSAQSLPPLPTCQKAFLATADSRREERDAMTCPWRHKHKPFHRKVEFILFHQKCHPTEMGRVEIEAFLTHLAVDRHIAASTQNQALSTLLFLYKEVLRQEVGSVDAVRARKPKRLPTVLTKTEALRVLN